MPTLHRIKLLATHCATAPTTTSTHSPTASPVVHLRRHRRRQTLRMLFDGRQQDPPEAADTAAVRVRRHKLKDLLVSSSPSPTPSPPPIGDDKRRRQCERQEHEGLLPAVQASGGRGFRFRTGSAFRRGGGAALGPVSSVFRHRLLRRAWRPALLTIPE